MSSVPQPLVPYDPAYADIYTDVERSIQQTFKTELARRGWSAYNVFTNQVDQKMIGDVKAAISIMKSSDIPDYSSGGGQSAQIHTTDGKVQAWPRWFILLYQIRVGAQNGVDVRNLDSVIRFCLPPRGGVLWLWNSQTQTFTKSYCNYEYAGYINRDVTANGLFDRITNIRFQVPSYMFPATNEVQITQVDVTDSSLDFELSVNSDN